ncbi:MAG: Ppx/GppA family phosphatase [Tepidibacter sp.]|jgi:exopolyphosphatase/guanosine-5'-triphosphate,3'-diphosphate pyrophosphatase|uniref:Ppx/GppA phosphatase family protein n=1 Tax=Tepidibacter sp. TaxID=2529387 RepID=UPI0025DC9709|nr:Ppx/GppA phosphatase family protein [Tepidibacter sp.]MCT4509480.1 Ppx/GppA family phosphatase [Tepidibacter sp.]
MKIAAVDIGTNSMRLLLADYVEGKFFNRQKYINTTRIGQNVDKEGIISDEAIQRNVDALHEFANIARKNGCEKIYAMGTSALRDSKNKEVFLKKAFDKSKVLVEIISGDNEADLGFLGVVQEVEEDDILVIDIGGGSTEFIVGNKSDGIKFNKSEDVGALRITEKFLTKDPINDKEFEYAKRYIETTIMETIDKISNLNITKVVGIGGTITSLSAIHQDLKVYDTNKIHKSIILDKDIEEILSNLKKLTVKEKRNLNGLQPKRADIITAGALILNIIIKKLEIKDISVSEFDNLEGLICQKLKRMS